MRVREMTADDWDMVRAIYQAGIDGGGATFTRECPGYAEWNAGHMASLRFVYEQDGAIAGWIAASHISARPAYAGVVEVSVYVSPDFRHHGIGMALMTKLIRESEAQGIWMLQSVIVEGNEASMTLHEKCGFRLVGRREKIAKDRFGQWRDTYLYERRSRVVQ